MRRALVIVLLAGALVPSARADGAPSIVETAGLGGIATPTGFRYTVVDSPTISILVRIAPSGRVVAEKYLPGRFWIPAVGYDGTPTGLSADGKTLVLVQPRTAFPRKRTRFLVLSSPGMFVRENVVLKGDFSFDAMSPDGSLLYFINYLSPTDPTKYAVRAFDRDGGVLLRKPVVDRTEPDEVMRGNPVSRATSPDGRWAYTLYDGAGKTPFVHALDTVGANAHCIDLDELAGRQDLPFLRLRLVGGMLSVVKGKRTLLLVDTKSFRVSQPGKPASTSERGTSWLPIGAGAAAALLAAAAGAAFLLRRRRPALT
ncbi:MAG TPA: hypothetical protein VE693_01410 [Gaiellaceae bacterium]|nr:hypothetical protein [Gaiellaceae bacterium]